jgi:hypothetical protein
VIGLLFVAAIGWGSIWLSLGIDPIAEGRE